MTVTKIELPFGSGVTTTVTQSYGENDHGKIDPLHPADAYLYYSIDFGVVGGSNGAPTNTPVVLAEGAGHVIAYWDSTPDAPTNAQYGQSAYTGPHGFGNFLTVQYDNGYIATYMHLKSGSVPSNLMHVGAAVHLGDSIAQVGTSGAIAGSNPHLHVTYGLSSVSSAKFSPGSPATLSNGSPDVIADGSQAANHNAAPVYFIAAANGTLLDRQTYTGDDVAVAISGITLDTGVSNTDGITSANTLTIKGTAITNSTVSLFDGGVQIGTTKTDNTGHWSFLTKTLSDGSHNFTAKETDSAGNASNSVAAFTATVDTHAPTKPVINSMSPDTGASATDGVTNSSTVNLKGLAEANSTVKLFDASTQIGSGIADSTGHWGIVTAHLSDGAHAIVASATDVAGNTSAASSVQSITVDTVAPVPVIVSETLNGSGALVLSGTSEANSVVSIYDGAKLIGSVPSNGSWGFTSPSLSNSVHSLLVTATDKAGNAGVSTSASLVGSQGADVLTSGSGNDFLTGGSGKDTFVFHANFGKDTITDFHQGQDVVQIDHTLFQTFASVQSHSHQVGSDTIITYDANDTIKLVGVTLSSLHATDFHIL